MLPTDCRCYLINLDRSPQRLERMHTHLSALGIDYERVPGVDGKELDEAEFQSYTRINRYYKPLQRGEVGCYLGHNRALQCFVDSGARYGLILEDDTLFEADACTVINDAIALRDTTENTLLHWDLLKFTQRYRKVRYMQLAALGKRHIVEYGLSVPTIANATIWTKDAAQRWLHAFNGDVTRPFDCDLQHPWEYDFIILSVHPPISTQSGVESTIGLRRGKKIRSPWPKFHYERKRVWPRLRHFSRRYGWGNLIAWLWKPHQIHEKSDFYK